MNRKKSNSKKWNTILAAITIEEMQLQLFPSISMQGIDSSEEISWIPASHLM